jgi:para-aminobenzoate synthetase
MRTLIIDNYDSFTYNLFQLLGEINGRPPVVLKNDDQAMWDHLDLDDFDNVVISPGPGRPERARDFGLGRHAIMSLSHPLLGVCLGHQGLCHLMGGSVGHAPEAMHGRLSAVYHDGSELFTGIPSPFRAVRYHSLLVSHLPDDLEATATTADGLLMAVRHRSRPMWGVQFHPESIATEHGRQLLENFHDLTAGHARRSPRRPQRIASQRLTRQPLVSNEGVEPPYRVLVRRVEAPDGERSFETLFARSRPNFWLDSSMVVPGLSRFSFMGGAGPLAELVRYEVRTGRLTVQGPTGVCTLNESLFSYLERQLKERRVPTSDLPFEFNLGYVGYLGYELKGDCGAQAPNSSPLPDATLLLCDRMLVIDHTDGSAYLLALATPGAHDLALRWFEESSIALALARSSDGGSPAGSADLSTHADGPPLDLVPRHDLDAYRDLIRKCLREIHDGESYEICLTNMLVMRASIDSLRTYKSLRRTSPAPFAALMNFPDCAILSSSPERFLRVDTRGNVESKPIKGTRPRGTTPDEDRTLAAELRAAEKDRAENLMIVDLVRNDLGRVCESGSIHVPKLFDVETYRTVHQLVSTVRGRLREDVSPVACVRAAFPGGSMTGAPKLRSMEIIDRLESGSRGVYSGALGYFSLSGALDLSIVIRTIVARRDEVSIGAGGAIVAQSEVNAEVDEMLLKADALILALASSTQRECRLVGVRATDRL